MKVLERIVDSLIRLLVSINDSQFGFIPGRGTTDKIFVVRQLQEKYLTANKRLYKAFIDLEKAFDRMPRKVIWWALRKFGVEEWLVRLVPGTYVNARSSVRVDEGTVKSLKWRSVFTKARYSAPLLFIIVLEALSREFRSWVPLEDLYADDLIIIAELLEECVKRLLTWKEAMEEKGLRVNVGKMKIMICGTGLVDAQETQWAQALDKGPWLQMYTVPGNCTPFGWQTTEGSPSWAWQAGGGSFLLLPRRHAVSSRWLWIFNHNTCENHLEEVQGAATSSLFPPPLFQDTWPHVQL